MAFGKSQDRQLVKEITKLVRAELGRGADVQFDANADAIRADGQHIQLGNIRQIWGQLDKRERSTWCR